MADPLLPNSVRSFIAERNWPLHHVEWHLVRQWDLLDAATRQAAVNMGWRRAAVQEGQAGNGLEFLAMHRAMVELLREAFPAQAILFDGWSSVPTDPLNANDPLPNGAATPFDPNFIEAVRRLEEQLDQFPSEDELGLYIETRLRPVPGNPFARSSDLTTGIHNYLHNRFSDTNSPVDMGNPQRNLENARFWRLHGWIDRIWTNYRNMDTGLRENDLDHRARIDREKDHLRGHVHGGPVPLSLPTVAVMSQLPVSLTSPFRETLSSQFHRLMTSALRPETVEDLVEYLQLAIKIEHFTLPLYLTAMWSLKPGNTEAHLEVFRSIAVQEMLHMGLVCNLLVALEKADGTPLDKRPRIMEGDALPRYPSLLPGIDASTVFSLAPFSKEQVEKFLRIELPKDGPIPDRVAGAIPPAPTIGDFYARIDEGLTRLDPQIRYNPTGQLTRSFYHNDGRTDIMFVIRSLDHARDAIRLIQEQGEGKPGTQGAPDDVVAHYYQFNQIVKQMLYVKQSDGTYVLDPSQPLPMPGPDDVYPMSEVPEGGYPDVSEAVAFDRIYSDMLDAMQEAWDQGSSTALGRSVQAMRRLQASAVDLMKMQRQSPYPPGYFGPAFRYIPGGPSPAGPVPVGQRQEGVTQVPGYDRVRQILDNAVEGQDIGSHRAFWRTMTRDQFVAQSIFGQKLVFVRSDGSFDPEESAVVKALEGRSPFGVDLPTPPPGARFPKMPLNYPPVPADQIAEIRAWIQGGCPERTLDLTTLVDRDAGGPINPTLHVVFWREFDDLALFRASPQVNEDVQTFFGVADAWLELARSGGSDQAWSQALADPSVRAAVRRLEELQRKVVLRHYGRPVSLLSLFDGFERFGEDTLPDDLERPQDVRHRMNGAIMWFYWSSFVDACIRLSENDAEIPADFWQGFGRAILLGLLRDGVFRKNRYQVIGFTADDAGKIAMRSHARGLSDNALAGELARRYRESGLG